MLFAFLLGLPRRLSSVSSTLRAAATLTRSFATNNFFDLTDKDLSDLVVKHGEQKFRAQQIKQWVFEKGVVNLDQMLDLPASLRSNLSNDLVFGSLQLASEQVSKDGTIKRAYRLHDGQLIETVLMPYDDGRRTVCISSQAGCAMGCVFCATGQMGFARQLTSTEIFEQVQQFSSELRRTKNEKISNVVFMGMGEPLANYKNVMQAVRRINSDLSIGARHITISTSGIAPRIRQLAEEGIQIGLAVSLHQTNNAKRDALMPVNKKYPIEELIDACKYYIEKTNRRVSFEWALIRGETDSVETAHELGKLLQGIICHVNVIPLNPTKGFDGKPTTKAGVDAFLRALGSYGVGGTARVRRGIDIDAGCGQLKADLLQKQKQQQQMQNKSTETGTTPVI